MRPADPRADAPAGGAHMGGSVANGGSAGQMPAMPSLSEMLAAAAPVTRPGPGRDNHHTAPPQRSTALHAPDAEPDGPPPAHPPYVPYAPYRPYLPYPHYATTAHPTPRLPLRPPLEADR
jgi:hypothetical protein